MLLKENEKSALIELKTILQANYGLIDFKVFGSKAREEDTAESDIDVMIELSRRIIGTDTIKFMASDHKRHEILIQA